MQFLKHFMKIFQAKNFVKFYNTKRASDSSTAAL